MKSIVHKLKKGIINKVIAGGGNGSTVIFDITHNHLQYTLHVYCTWRFAHENKVVIGSNDPNTDFADNLGSIVGVSISEITATVFNDIKIRFDNGYQFNIFCDITPKFGSDYVGENWSLCDISNNICYNLTNQFTITTEKYSDI